ncbi:unnamed protein product [Pseudo-nitzschia multistriata]|uniref:Sulfotransferase domain-containing protein n=1 Tax=Pseudo-nitzschia multistriata TaxID=183589 RepID=A0A448Z146_9STRA|nr:unnamed protein product [Pseudo-nitzschia multistriata]
MGENDRYRRPLSSRHGLILTSISFLAAFSILEFYGKLQIFFDVKQTYYAKSNSTNIVHGTKEVLSKGSDNLSTKDHSIGIGKNTIDEPETPDTGSTNTAPGIDGVEIIDKPLQRGEEKSLEVAWLMSFPNSGTTYTNHLIQDYTRTTTATNYGQEQDTKNETISIFADSIDGPFFRYPTWSLPPKFILTKTHCGGECDACQTPGSKQYNNTLGAFEEACRSGKRIVNRTKVRTTYSSDIPKRAVHLIRDPFDNIVARLHLKERRWARRSNDKKYEERVDRFNKTKDGFRAYCRFRDTDSLKQEMRQRVLSDELLQFAKNIPCYAEFITYTQWHNHAIDLVANKKMPVLTLFYEDYASNWDETVNQLLRFLALSPAKGAKAEEFILGKHYDEFYFDEEKSNATKLIRALASPELWELLQRYLR